MGSRFEIVFLEQAIDFMAKVDKKAKAKIYYNLDKAKLGLDPKLFKKLTDDIWEFRKKYGGLQYRLFAFWDRTEKTDTLVISTHGVIKKTDKVPKAEMEKAKQIRTAYFEQYKRAYGNKKEKDENDDS